LLCIISSRECLVHSDFLLCDTFDILAQVARKLGIDSAPAMVGWRASRGWRQVPDLVGAVVCSENVTVLKAAYYEWVVLKAQRDALKRKQINAERWKKLTSRAVIYAALKQKYSLSE
jgi:hypothetical protein